MRKLLLAGLVILSSCGNRQPDGTTLAERIAMADYKEKYYNETYYPNNPNAPVVWQAVRYGLKTCVPLETANREMAEYAGYTGTIPNNPHDLLIQLSMAGITYDVIQNQDRLVVLGRKDEMGRNRKFAFVKGHDLCMQYAAGIRNSRR